MPFSTQYALAAVLGLAVLYRIVAAALHSLIMKTFTAVHDLPQLGTPRRRAKEAGTAVICGGSVAGLLAARVCADHFERVVVIEPEAWTFTTEAREPRVPPTRPVQGSQGSYNAYEQKRPRVYQYTAFHAYQVMLTYVLRKLFAGFDEHARRWGLIVSPCDMHAITGGQPFPHPWKQYGGKLPDQICGARRTLEPLLRDRVQETCPDIEFVHGTVTGFVQGDGNQIRAVSVRKADGHSLELKSALVVDCTGVTQLGLKLLTRAVSLPTDIRENYDPQMNYASLFFPLPPNFNENARALTLNRDGTGGPAGGPYDAEFRQFFFVIVPDAQKDYRMLYMCRQGEDNVCFTAGGWGCEVPTSLELLREHAMKLKSPVPDYAWRLFDLLEPVADDVVVGETHATSCSWIHYEKSGDVLPHNFVALGDAFMKLNPLFGQGVTKASLEALTLDGVLRTLSPSQPSFGRTCFKRLARRTQGIWDNAKTTDYGHKTTTPVPGESLEGGSKFIKWYSKQLGRMLKRNEHAANLAWLRFQHLSPTLLLLSPRVAASVFWDALWYGSGEA